MKLYGYFRSSAAYRVRIALGIKNIKYINQPVPLLEAAHKTSDYLALNPQGRVPSLELDDGTVLTQSPAILEYLEEIFPSPALLPHDPIMRAHVRSACAVIGCDIHPLNNTSTLAYFKNTFGQDQEAISRWYGHWITEGFTAIEAMLEPGPYAFGGQAGMADLYLVPQIFNARRFEVPLEAFPKISAVDAACQMLEAFWQAHPDQQPDAI